MNTFTNSGAEVFQWILHISWQAAVLVGLILLAQWLFRNRLSPAWRHGLWLLLLLRLLLPVSPPSTVSVFNVAPSPPSFGGIALAPMKPPARLPEFLPAEVAAAIESQAAQGLVVEARSDSPALLLPHRSAGQRPVGTSLGSAVNPAGRSAPAGNGLRLAFGLWLTGMIVLGLRLVWSSLRFRSRIRGDVPTNDQRVLRVLEEARAALGVRQRIALIETECVATPAVWGLLHKRLFLPQGMMRRFSDEELRHIFLHELAHLKRRDLEVNGLVALLQVVHWFNPVLWFAFGRMRADRELAADALALSRIRERESTAYGETILKVLARLARRPAMPGLVGIAEDKARLAERFQAIARHGTLRPWKWIAPASVAAIAALALTDAKQGGHPEPDDPAGVEGGRQFEIRVVDHDTALPLAGVTVEFELEYYGGEPSRQERVTDEDGKTTIRFEPMNLKRFAYHLPGSDLVAPHGEWVQHQTAWIPAEFEIQASHGVEIGGTVVDEAGRPLAGAEVLFDRSIVHLQSGSDHPIRSRTWRASAGERLATTDAAGVWRARRMYPGGHWAALRVRHPDFADAVYSTDVTRAMEAAGEWNVLDFDDLVAGQARFVMAPGVSLSGRVVGPTGMPRPEVQVRCGEWHEAEYYARESTFWERVADTGNEGRFEIERLPQRRMYLAVQSEGSAPVVHEVDLREPQEEIMLQLADSEGLKGQVTDPEGQPVAGAHVRVVDWSIWRGIRWETITDTDGRFQWADAPAEKFQVRIEREGYIGQNRILAGGEIEQTVRLNPTLKLSGRVVAAANQEPVTRFWIVWGDRDDRLQGLRRFALEGMDGIYSIDVGKLHSDLWAGGYAHEFVVRIEAEGYRPATSRVFSAREGDVGEISHDFALERAELISGTVVDDAGDPVAGAQVALKTPTSRLRLAGNPWFEKLDPVEFLVTDPDGRFHLSHDPDASHLVIVHERGIAWVEAEDLGTRPVIELQSWGRVEGRVWEYERLVANQEVWHSSSLLAYNRPPFMDFFVLRGSTDHQGRFSFEFVPPGRHRFYRMIRTRQGRGSSGPAEVVEVRAGETALVKLGGDGRPVTGHIRIKNPYVEIEWQKAHHRARTVMPERPAEVQTEEDYASWRQREDIQRAFDSIRSHPIHFSDDGSFRIDEMIPGSYQFSIQIHDPRDRDAFAYGRYIANYSEVFEVPDTDQRDSREPLDIGVFELALIEQVQEGETPAPQFAAMDLRANEFQLADFQGKYVLLDFWATWCGPCIAELPYLREVHRKFGGREDFVMISLSLDAAMDTVQEFVKANDMPWRQGHLGPNSGVPAQYGVQGIPALFLIEPGGRIVATGLRGASLMTELGRWLE